MEFVPETETILNAGEEIQIIEKKIKKLDIQIALLTELKTKYINKLNLIVNKSAESTISSSDSSIGYACHSSDSAVSSSALKNFLTADEKINIFKNYFMGRDDLYARLWKSNKTGKQGYSPVCGNEWVSALCRKPKVKCANCSNREFLPYDYSAVKMHLTGKHIAGIYPLTKDEKCYFLSFDFDGDNWFEDAVSLKTTCLEENLHSAIERSRSGEGGHLWIFFKEKIPAVTARKLGTYIITKTISKNFKFDMKSYDRMFPNQDTMPEGGFGNLIALPFQLEGVKSILKDYNVKLNNHDKRFKGKKIKAVFNGMLTDIQQNALNSILKTDSGILVAPPGIGKTVIAIAAVAKRKTSTLILVHRKPLMEQWRLQISALLGIDKKEEDYPEIIKINKIFTFMIIWTKMFRF